MRPVMKASYVRPGVGGGAFVVPEDVDVDGLPAPGVPVPRDSCEVPYGSHIGMRL